MSVTLAPASPREIGAFADRLRQTRNDSQHNRLRQSRAHEFIVGLTDFGPGRSKLSGNSAGDYLKVHDQGPEAERDSTTTDPIPTASSSRPPTYSFTRRPDGTTEVDVVVVREGKNLKGRMLGIPAGIIGKRMLEKRLGKTVRRPKPGTPRRGRQSTHSQRPLRP